MKFDDVERPRHYLGNGLEVIEFIESWRMLHHAGSVTKYICRADHKDDFIKDLRKALWYLRRVIENLPGEMLTVEKRVGIPARIAVEAFNLDAPRGQILAHLVEGLWGNVKPLKKAAAILESYIEQRSGATAR